MNSSRLDHVTKFPEIAYEECLEHLANGQIGRVAVSVGALPTILPVHYCLNRTRDFVVIRSVKGTKLSAAMKGAIVAFEIDHHEPATDTGWSVVIQGRSSEVVNPVTVLDYEDLPLRPVTPDGIDDHFIQVSLDIVTGRRLDPLDDRR